MEANEGIQNAVINYGLNDHRCIHQSDASWKFQVGSSNFEQWLVRTRRVIGARELCSLIWKKLLENILHQSLFTRESDSVRNWSFCFLAERLFIKHDQLAQMNSVRLKFQWRIENIRF